MSNRAILTEEVTESPAEGLDMAAEVERLREELKAARAEVERLKAQNLELAQRVIEAAQRIPLEPNPFQAPQPPSQQDGWRNTRTERGTAAGDSTYPYTITWNTNTDLSNTL